MEKRKKKIFDIIQIGNKNDIPSALFDVFIVIVIFLNLFVTLFETYEESLPYINILKLIELITIIIFTIEYVLRVITADYLYPEETKIKARIKFIFSFYGVIDFLTFFPYYLPITAISGVVAFRMFRVIRIFRLFKINSQYDAFNVITSVLEEKKNQLISSISMILILMTASSLCMYSLEHDAQPEQFKNAFSGIWWSVSTLLTVGYGDIYPITTLGKIMGIVIAFLGVGMVAIPTGIISAGFVEQYTKLKLIGEKEESELQYVTTVIEREHAWKGMKVGDIKLPSQLIPVILIRDGEAVTLNDNIELRDKDRLVIGTRYNEAKDKINIRKIKIEQDSSWNGLTVKDIDISRLETIAMINRKGRSIVPSDNTQIKSQDEIIIFSKKR